MPRIRTIKPEFWSNEDLSELPEITHMFAAALLNHCDDEGYFNANDKLLKAAIFPIREPSRTIPVMLQELSNQGYIELFSGEKSRIFGRVKNFNCHQSINKPKPSKIKGLLGVPYQYRTDPVPVPVGKEQGTGNNNTLSLGERDDVKPPPDNEKPPPSDDNKTPPSGAYRMYAEWLPPENDLGFRCHGCGIDRSLITPEMIFEFTAYWSDRSDRNATGQWILKLINSAKHEKIKIDREKNRDAKNQRTDQKSKREEIDREIFGDEFFNGEPSVKDIPGEFRIVD